MTKTGYKIAALAMVVALAGASVGHVATDSATTSYFTDSEVANVSGNMPVKADADATNNNPVDEGAPVKVTGANSTDDSGIVSYEWDYDGDGTIDATGVNQTHTFMDQGEYNVTLVVTDTTGLVATATTTVTVHNVPPTASAGSDRTVNVDEQVTFDASGTTDPGADELQYEWDLDGDGTYDVEGPKVANRYRSEGTYQVTMNVTDGDGGVDTDTLSVEVQNVPPTADAGGPLTVVTGEPTLDGSGSAAGDSSDTLTYKWDVNGNGTYEVTGVDPGHYYTDVGTYNVTLRLKDGDGGVDTDTTTVTVETDTDPPIAEFALDRANVNDKTITFDGTGSSDNARIVDYEWRFGDGTTATGPTPSHSYNDPGKYDITLTVTDSAGYENTTTKTVTIENEPPTADAGGDRTAVAGAPLTLDASGSSAGDISDTLRYEWDFDDGQSNETSDPAINHTFSEAGTYNVTLRVSDGDGGVDTDTTTVTVETDTDPPDADAGADQTALVNESVAFDGTGSSDDGTIESYEWDFGDGTTATGATPSHTYDAPGTYTAALTVTDDDGNADTDTIKISVEAQRSR